MDVGSPAQEAGDDAPPPSDRTCLLVLGMHRSGTSAVCGVLHQLGAERPIREMPPQPDNEKGFFEPIEISAIHDRMLASAGLHWFDWEPLPRFWSESSACRDFLDELAAAATIDFPGCGPFLLKDPRICRFVDLWLTVLARLKTRPVVVFQYRHPSEVARSLKARNGFPLAHGLLMWLRHVVDAEKASRSVQRSFVNFADLLVDWQTELSPIVESSQVKLPRMSARAIALAGDFLDGSLRHQVISRVVESAHDWVARSFAALERLRADPYDREAMDTLDDVRRDFDAASAAFSPAFHQLHLQLDHLGRAANRTTQAEAALASSQQAFAASQQALADAAPHAERMPQIMEELEEARRNLAANLVLVERVSSLEAELNHANQALAVASAAAGHVEGMKRELETARHAVAMAQQTSELVPRLEAELAEARERTATFQQVTERVSIQEVELAAMHHRLAATQASAERVPGLEAEIVGTGQTLTAAQALANRVPVLEANLAAVHHQLAAAQPVANRVPALEAERIHALQEIAELQQQLAAARTKLGKTLGGQLAAITAKILRRAQA